MIQASGEKRNPTLELALTTLLDTRGTLSTMLRESFTSPHYTLYHYICPLIHTSQGRSKGVFIVLSDGEGRLWRLETPGGSGGAGRPGPKPGGLAIPWIHRLTSSHGPYCSSKAVIGRLA
ncbi:hypothetical protein U9M48_042706, partial [Paspalum notatum var. saurae]